MTEVRDQRVLITGAASGIGRLMAMKFGALGAELILWDVDAQGLAAVAEEIEGCGGRVSTYVCDLCFRAHISETAGQVIAAHGGVDVLVNNAGIITGKRLCEADDGEIERSFAVNTLAHFWTTRAFLPGMLERDRGHVVTIASAAGFAGAPKLVDYASSKFAAVGFDDALRLELKAMKSAVRTTVVCPYLIDTGMVAGATTRFPWLLPILDPDTVASRIVAAVRQNKPRLILPGFVIVTFLGRLLPVRAFDWLMGVLGITTAMDGLIGRGE